MLEHPAFRPKVCTILVVAVVCTNMDQLFFVRGHPNAGQEEKFPDPDNPSKMRRSVENAEHIGLYPLVSFKVLWNLPLLLHLPNAQSVWWWTSEVVFCPLLVLSWPNQSQLFMLTPTAQLIPSLASSLVLFREHFISASLAFATRH